MQIAMLEQQKKVADRKVEDEVKAKEIVIGGQTTAQPATTVHHKMHGNPNMNDTLKKETEVTHFIFRLGYFLSFDSMTYVSNRIEVIIRFL